MYEPPHVPLNVEAIRKFQASLPAHLQHRHVSFLLDQLSVMETALRKLVVEAATRVEPNVKDALECAIYQGWKALEGELK